MSDESTSYSDEEHIEKLTRDEIEISNDYAHRKKKRKHKKRKAHKTKSKQRASRHHHLYHSNSSPGSNDEDFIDSAEETDVQILNNDEDATDEYDFDIDELQGNDMNKLLSKPMKENDRFLYTATGIDVQIERGRSIKTSPITTVYINDGDWNDYAIHKKFNDILKNVGATVEDYVPEIRWDKQKRSILMPYNNLARDSLKIPWHRKGLVIFLSKLKPKKSKKRHLDNPDNSTSKASKRRRQRSALLMKNNIRKGTKQEIYDGMRFHEISWIEAQENSIEIWKHLIYFRLEKNWSVEKIRNFVKDTLMKRKSNIVQQIDEAQKGKFAKHKVSKKEITATSNEIYQSNDTNTNETEIRTAAKGIAANSHYYREVQAFDNRRYLEDTAEKKENNPFKQNTEPNKLNFNSNRDETRDLNENKIQYLEKNNVNLSQQIKELIAEKERLQKQIKSQQEMEGNEMSIEEVD